MSTELLCCCHFSTGIGSSSHFWGENHKNIRHTDREYPHLLNLDVKLPYAIWNMKFWEFGGQLGAGVGFLVSPLQQCRTQASHLSWNYWNFYLTLKWSSLPWNSIKSVSNCAQLVQARFVVLMFMSCTRCLKKNPDCYDGYDVTSPIHNNYWLILVDRDLIKFKTDTVKKF